MAVSTPVPRFEPPKRRVEHHEVEHPVYRRQRFIGARAKQAIDDKGPGGAQEPGGKPEASDPGENGVVFS